MVNHSSDVSNNIAYLGKGSDLKTLAPVRQGHKKPKVIIRFKISVLECIIRCVTLTVCTCV